ncbi:MAG TPA: VOC family protein [Candidatus Saccharimonas sp.]|nr:VOC family protein [Candidatus Saccharimonas sp.]
MNLNTIMIGSEQPQTLIKFYGHIFGKPGWHEEGSDWAGWRVGDGNLVVGPHDKVKGKNPEPGRFIINIETDELKDEFDRIKDLGAEVVAEPYHPGEDASGWLATFADPDGNYFQLATPWKDSDQS